MYLMCSVNKVYINFNYKHFKYLNKLENFSKLSKNKMEIFREKLSF